ncbi:CoA transferase [Novosphingobium aquae]|uniref:CoA transferase n=1 Tax=Novosphingobium aquae TaxID=3133435 RepID=A0ABU8S913_9SPHN
MNSAVNSLPLKGLRVLDLVEGSLGSIGRTLAEWGATVVRIEPRSGAADRLAEPRIADISLSFTVANLGKDSVALDLNQPADKAEFELLASTADILIEDFGVRRDRFRPFDIEAMRRTNPALVVLSLSGFGATTSFTEWQATDPVLHAMSGELSRSGLPGREPLLPPGELGLQCAASQGLLAVLAARYSSLVQGRGDWLDLSLLDGAAAALDPGYGSSGSAAQGVPASKLPRGRPEARFQYPIIACADGYVRICMLAPRQWRAMFDWLGRPEEFADPAFNTLRARYKSKTLIPRIAALFAGKSSAELQAEAQKRGVPLSPVLSLDQALSASQFTSRAALVEVELVSSVTVTVPNGIIEFDGKRAGLAGPPPTAGSGQDIIARGWPARTTHSAGDSGLAGKLPLAGLRVLDLGVIVVGAETGRLLADLGADVIKIENASFPDGSRQTRGEPISVSFAVGHRNQRSLGLNLRSDEGKALFHDLAAKADVILSNFKPGTLESLGLAPKALLARNPKLIIVDSSAFGPTGPESRRMGFGPLVRAAAGLSLQWRYPDDPTSFSDALTVYPDHVCGRIGAAGVLALLLRRLETGRGGTISIAQAEVMLGHMATEIACISARERGHTVEKFSQPDAPWGVFPCAGEDEWCVITVRDNMDWQALCRVIGRNDLAKNQALFGRHGRLAEIDFINAGLKEWLADRTADDAALALQTEGVPAAPMLRVADLPQHPYYREREFLRQVSHPKIDEFFYAENLVVNAERLSLPHQNPAPMQGEHSIIIAQELFGFDNAKIEKLLADGVLEAYSEDVGHASP